MKARTGIPVSDQVEQQTGDAVLVLCAEIRGPMHNANGVR